MNRLGWETPTHWRSTAWKTFDAITCAILAICYRHA